MQFSSINFQIVIFQEICFLVYFEQDRYSVDFGAFWRLFCELKKSYWKCTSIMFSSDQAFYISLRWQLSVLWLAMNIFLIFNFNSTFVL